MPLVTKPYNYTNGQVIDALQLDQNLDALYSLINGGLDGANLAPQALNDSTKFKPGIVLQTLTSGVPYTQDLFGQGWIVSGGACTKDGTNANQVNFTDIVAYVPQTDGSQNRVKVTANNVKTVVPSATYYLDVQNDGTIQWAQLHPTNPYITICTVTSDVSGNVNVITDTRVTDPKMRGSLNSTLYTLERQVANLTAVSTLANRTDSASGFIFDLMDGLNGGSIGKIDKTSTNSTGTIAASASAVVVPVKATTGFAVGQEVTIFDDVNLERRVITAISAGVSLTFAAMTNSYKAQAQICRSSVVQDTVNKLLKFGGWSYLTPQSAASTVVASAYDTSGNGGRKSVMTTNGNLFTVVRNGTTDFRIQKSTDNGVTTPWPTIVTVTESVNDVAMATDGTYLYVLSSFSTIGAKFRKYDQAGVLQGSVIDVDTGQTAMGNVSIARAPDGSLHASWASKNATYPNSFNPRYNKSTDGGVTWAAPTQVSTYNTAGQDNTNPSVIVRSNNYPVIFYQLNVGTTSNSIRVNYWNGTTWSTVASVYDAASQNQTNSTAIVKQNGSNIGRIICCWNGIDATETRQNVRWSYSDDGVVTWSAMVKITSGNTVDRQKGVLAEDASGNIYIIYMDNTGISYQQLPNGSTTWGAVQTLDAAGTNPAVIERLDFTVPLTIYMSASAVKFKGTWVTTATTPVLVEDVRYNIAPANNISSAVAWVDRETDAGLSLAAALSIHSATEAYSAMTKTTATVDGTTSEDQFVGSGVSNIKATVRLTMTRTSTSVNKGIKSVMGAVGV